MRGTRSQIRSEIGGVATEYGVLIVFIAIAMAIGAIVLGTGLSSLFSSTGTTVDQVEPPAVTQEAPGD